MHQRLNCKVTKRNCLLISRVELETNQMVHSEVQLKQLKTQIKEHAKLISLFDLKSDQDYKIDENKVDIIRYERLNDSLETQNR